MDDRNETELEPGVLSVSSDYRPDSVGKRGEQLLGTDSIQLVFKKFQRVLHLELHQRLGICVRVIPSEWLAVQQFDANFVENLEREHYPAVN